MLKKSGPAKAGQAATPLMLLALVYEYTCLLICVPLPDYKKKEASIERSTKESNVQHQCVSMILNDVVKKFPPQVVSSEQVSLTGKALEHFES